MASRKKKRHGNSKTGLQETSRASRDTEAKFPSHLHPIIQCKHSVLTLSRLEFYGGIAFGAVVWVLPVSGVTRSLILLFALAPLVDVVWRSPWSHAWLRVSKIRAAALLIGIYIVICTSMILHDHGVASETVKTYVVEHVERFVNWVYVLVGAAGYYLLAKLFSLMKSYARTRRAEKVAARQKVMESHPGWLDYRLDAEKSSTELHSLVARISRVVKWMAWVFTHKGWFMGKDEKDSPIVRTQSANWLLAFVLNKSSKRMEPDLKELESNANLFITSTEGHLKVSAKQGDLQVAELYEYFQAQLKDIREVTNAFSQFPPAFAKAKGTSRELNAALDRSLKLWRSQITILRKLEGHCARMVKLTNDGFNRALEKPLTELATKLVETVEMMAERAPNGVVKKDAQEKALELRKMLEEVERQ